MKIHLFKMLPIIITGTRLASSCPVPGFLLPIVKCGLNLLSVNVGFENTQYNDRLIAVFIILDNSKCRKSFTKTNAVRKNTAIVFFQLVYDSKSSVLLKIIQQIPYPAFLLNPVASFGSTSSEISSRNSLKILCSVTK